MLNKKIQSKLPKVEQRWVLLMRHHDTRNDNWSAWEEPNKADLNAKYGTNPEQWRDTCSRWIEMGGTYEFKIVRRTDEVEWSLHYANAPHQATDGHPQA